jgi:hypothetical protein
MTDAAETIETTSEQTNGKKSTAHDALREKVRELSVRTRGLNDLIALAETEDAAQKAEIDRLRLIADQNDGLRSQAETLSAELKANKADKSAGAKAEMQKSVLNEERRSGRQEVIDAIKTLITAHQEKVREAVALRSDRNTDRSIAQKANADERAFMLKVETLEELLRSL